MASVHIDISPFSHDDHRPMSRRDVAGAWFVIILFLAATLVGSALDWAVAIGP